MSNNVGIFDKIVISMAILSFIVALFKAGIMAAIGKFFFVIAFFYVAKVLWFWIMDNR
ncbi:TPA: hypothetical protein N2903_003991 [Vibrio parahaemolyticus]|uniref:hypothetical protein n=1 Tax=Vibrio parahaemolyticus TaxID=670 RepID=UPI0015DEBC01|nr:hypothetical protein [Vibrio parahaemolyticus]EHZ2723059.1 hypothetical protein [Vibrio parahaemolyticus]EIO4604144.1 hypothetical protein [Vibrio parahaemolyticus]EIV1595788.1 hypothetical protein [Vibrio parahaemolyticus]EJG2371838.1 hypothetical protein [Vibrio parahaemolyticus]MCX8905598.1 hypothetical protein [Vibrio parahaemolyticus]